MLFYQDLKRRDYNLWLLRNIQLPILGNCGFLNENLSFEITYFNDPKDLVKYRLDLRILTTLTELNCDLRILYTLTGTNCSVAAATVFNCPVYAIFRLAGWSSLPSSLISVLSV